MAAANYTVSEDQFVCSICLSVFMDPVSTPCGHNFCKRCISSYWDKSDHFLCPLCKEEFKTRPQLRTNTLLSNMASQFLKTPEVPREEASDPEVPCDICSGTKVKAVMSCLVCLVSYCETHLGPHETVPVLRRHQLVAPVRNLDKRMCTHHHKPLELFCKTDSVCVCTKCPYSEHKSHKIVPLSEECEERKTEVTQMMEESKGKIEKIHTSLDLSKRLADKATGEGQEVITALGQSVQKNLEDLKEGIHNKLRKRERLNKVLIAELEEGIFQLEKRRTEMEKPAYAQDPLHFLQTFPSLKSDPCMNSWTGVSICQASFDGAVVRSLFELEKVFTEVLDREYRADLKAKQKCAVNVTFDPDTAHPNLVLSHDKKQVHYREVRRNVPDNPKRFSDIPCVLGQQCFSKGKFYYEVQVTGKTHWFLGVTRESINRRGELKVKSSSLEFWLICLDDGKLSAAACPSVNITLRRVPQKIGVFVDYEEGVVSFHDVDTATPIYFFTDCCFKGTLFPFFSPWYTAKGRNKSPIIISLQPI